MKSVGGWKWLWVHGVFGGIVVMFGLSVPLCRGSVCMGYVVRDVCHNELGLYYLKAIYLNLTFNLLYVLWHYLTK